MKLEHITPMESGAWWKAGRSRIVGNWTYTDTLDEDTGLMHRYVAHRGTVMGEFYCWRSTWMFAPISVGWGSVSDQNGMNKIMPKDWRFRRNGGNPRYEFCGVVHEF